MADESVKSRSEQLKAVSVDDINDTYHRGYMTALDRNKLLLEKAHQTVAGSLEEHGYLKAILQQSIQHVQEGWDNLKESIVRTPTTGTVGEQVKGEAYYAGLAVWGQMQVVFSVMNAVGDVTGQVAENMALKAGASPGLARALNLGVNLGTAFVPYGMVSKSFAKTVQDVGKAGTVAKTAKVAEQAAPAAEKLAEDFTKIKSVLGEGLKVENVPAAHWLAEGSTAPEKFVVEFPGNAVTKKVVAVSTEAEAKKLVEMAGGGTITQAGETVTKTVQQQFAEDLAINLKKMERITKVQTHEQTEKMADALGLSLEDLKNVVPGVAFNEKEAMAYGKALQPQVDLLATLAKRAVATNDLPDLEALARHGSEFLTLSPTFRAAEVTAGRTVEILKTTPMKAITDMMTHWNPEAIAKGDFKGAMGTFAEDIVAMSEHPDKLAALAVQSQSLWHRMGETAWPRMREAYINLLLARPLTQVRNFIGNSVAATNAVLDRYAGGMFGLGKEGGLAMMEGNYLAKGMAYSVRDGMKQFAEAYKTLSPDDISKLDYVPHQIPGLLGRIINSPGDTMRGMDNFFKTILRRGSYYAEAYRTATERGYTAKEAATYIAERVNNPTQSMIMHGEDFALYQTFQNELGTLGKAAQKALQAGPLVTWFPFMKTPINLAKYAWNRTPGLNLMAKSLYEDILAGGQRADLAIGKLTISSLQAHYFFNLAQEGLLTGSGPIDPQLKASWQAAGNTPYSVKGAYGSYPLTNMEPGTTAMGLSADFAQVMNQLDDPTVEQGAMAVTFAVMKNLVSKSYWQSVSDVVDITSNLTRGEPVGAKVTDVLTRPLTTVLTGGPLGSTAARIVDPLMRESRTFMDQLTAKVPGYSSTLAPRRDGYGDPILPPQTIGSPWLAYISPFTYNPASKDRVKLEGDKLHAKLPTFPWNIGGNVQDDFDIREPQPGDKFGVGLTDKQRDRWQQIYKNILRHPEMGMEKQVLDNPLYQEQMPALQRETFEGYARDAKSTALDALLVEDPELQKSLLKQDTAAIRPLLQMQKQGTLDQRLREGTDLIDSLSREQQQNLLRWGILEPEEPAMSR